MIKFFQYLCIFMLGACFFGGLERGEFFQSFTAFFFFISILLQLNSGDKA